MTAPVAEALPQKTAKKNGVDAVKESSTKRVTRPDKVEHNRKLEDLTRQIDEIKAKHDKVKEAIANFGANDKNSAEKQKLNEQIEAVKAEQAKFDEERSALQSQLKTAQDSVRRKIDEIKSTKDRVPYRSTVEIDRKLAEIDAQVSSGSLTLAEEKRLLNEGTNLRKHRKVIEALGPHETQIELEKKKADDLKLQLDKMGSGKFKKQLDTLFTQLRAFQSERSESSKKLKALRDERDELSKKMTDLFQQRRDLQAEFRKQRDEWDAFMKEEKARKDAMYKAQRAEYARQKKLENVKKALEDAEIPAYVNEISMCNALTAMLQGDKPAVANNINNNVKAEKCVRPVSETAENLPKGVSGVVALKKKSDRIDDEFYFGGKQKKSSTAGNQEKQAKEKDLKFDLTVINQFLKLNIQVPKKQSDLAKTLEALAEKKQYFLDNQERATKENLEKAKAMEQKVLKELEAAAEAEEEVVVVAEKEVVVEKNE